MKSIDIEANTTKEAIELALKELKCKRKDVDVQILVEEKKGLFGMKGAHSAKVRVSLKDSVSRETEEPHSSS